MENIFRLFNRCVNPVYRKEEMYIIVHALLVYTKAIAFLIAMRRAAPSIKRILRNTRFKWLLMIISIRAINAAADDKCKCKFNYQLIEMQRHSSQSRTVPRPPRSANENARWWEEFVFQRAANFTRDAARPAHNFALIHFLHFDQIMYACLLWWLL